MKNGYKRLLILFFLIFAFFTGFSYIEHIYDVIPDELYVYSNKDTIVDLDVPVTAVIKETNQTIDFSKPVTFQAKEKADYSLEYKLFNLISLPSGKLSVLSENSVYACGIPIGLYIKTAGIFVAETAQFNDINGNVCSPSSGILASGDYITDIDGTSISRKNQVTEILNNCHGETMCIGFIRNSVYETAQITPAADENGQYKLGIWVKDDSQGIGTLTYIDKNGNYGALGHGMSDTSTGRLLNIDNGFLYKTNIMSITKGTQNVPGEYIGTIDYSSTNRIGFIRANTERGIFGTISELKCEQFVNVYNLKSYEIGFNREIHKGSAYILVYLNDELNLYDIEITDLSYKNEKNITFECTSDSLLEITNGIVQGMSGSPIIQDGKIVGAVTHVCVNL